jgi:biopolymer transport protein ExbD
MSKIKIPHRSPRIDMTPMVDLFMLLLTFFMLTASFKPQEAVQVDTPSSVSETSRTNEKNLITVFISKDNKVFFNVDDGLDTSQHVRSKVLKGVGEQLRVKFTDEQIKKFVGLASFGMPIKDIPAWLDATDVKEKEAMQVGIPIDSTDNQLAQWVLMARNFNPNADVAIKGDNEADYKVVKRVLNILQDYKVNKFDLTTTLEKIEVKLEK